MTDPNDDRPRSFFGFGPRKEAEHSTNNNEPPAFIRQAMERELGVRPTAPIGAPRGRSARVAELEAKAAHEWEQLEQALAFERQNAENLRAENAVFKVMIEQLNKKISIIEKQDERLVRENAEVYDRVKCAAELLVRLQKPVLSETSSFDDRGAATGRISSARNIEEIEKTPPAADAVAQPINWPKPPTPNKSNPQE